MEKERRIILSIETTVRGGSLSILENGKEIDVWAGSDLSVSKAENFLDQLSIRLKKNKIKKKQIELIGVSKETPSMTGEKIGRAISKGLCRAYGCRLVEIPVLTALLVELEDDFQGKIIVAIALGKNRVFWQHKEKKGALFYDLIEPAITTESEFSDVLEALSFEKTLIVASSAQEIVFGKSGKVIILRETPAHLLGKSVLRVR